MPITFTVDDYETVFADENHNEFEEIDLSEILGEEGAEGFVVGEDFLYEATDDDLTFNFTIRNNSPTAISTTGVVLESCITPPVPQELADDEMLIQSFIDFLADTDSATPNGVITHCPASPFVLLNLPGSEANPGAVANIIGDNLYTLSVQPRRDLAPGLHYDYIIITGNFGFVRRVRVEIYVEVVYRYVDFDLQGGMDPANEDFDTQRLRFNTTATEPPTIPTKVGYCFLGWHTVPMVVDDDCDEDCYYDDDDYGEEEVEPIGLFTRFLNFLGFNLDTYDSSGACLNLPPDSPLFDTLFDFDDTQITQNTRLYAHWHVDPVRVTFVAGPNGQIALPNNPVYVRLGLTLTDRANYLEVDVDDLIPEPVADHNFEFLHWTSSNPNHRILEEECDDDDEDGYYEDDYGIGGYSYEEDEECENVYRYWFTADEIAELILTGHTEFTAHFVPIGNVLTFTKTNDYLYLDMNAMYPNHPNLLGLPGAHFELRRRQPDGSWGGVIETAISDANGNVTFTELLTVDGVYQLLETWAPAGFSRPHGYWEIRWVEELILFEGTVNEITVDEGFTFTAVGTVSLIPAVRHAVRTYEGEQTLYYYIGNFPIIELPATGGFGSVLLTLIGGLSLMFVVLLYVRQKVTEERI